ncbi:UTRA domain-containing protein [Streptomyces sp. NPDC005195]|uniref:GntR family transcriptional regulator n=1 Tax=Streptomyces sp. NPDC005195 TaxID=3154561 RepID=UPI0033B4B6FF
MTDKWISASEPYLAPRALGERDAWSEEAAGHGRKGGQELIFAGTAQAPSPVARALGVATGGGVVARKRIITLDGDPVELTDSYYPTSVASGTPLASAQKIKGGAVTLLANLGHHVTDIHEDISARMPTADERRLLHLEPDEPVLLLLRVHVAADGKPVQVDAITMPSRGRHLSYDLKKQG